MVKTHHRPRNFFARNLNHCIGQLLILEPILIGENENLDNPNPQPFSPIYSNRQRIARFKVPHSVIVRAPGLLPMLYTPSELEQEFGVPARSIREWLDRGLPHQRDGRGHIWIEGRCFADWVKAWHESKPGKIMSDDEAYCFSCRHPVKLINPISTRRGKQLLRQGVCPVCEHVIYRGGRHG